MRLSPRMARTPASRPGSVPNRASFPAEEMRLRRLNSTWDAGSAALSGGCCQPIRSVRGHRGQQGGFPDHSASWPFLGKSGRLRLAQRRGGVSAGKKAGALRGERSGFIEEQRPLRSPEGVWAPTGLRASRASSWLLRSRSPFRGWSPLRGWSSGCPGATGFWAKSLTGFCVTPFPTTWNNWLTYLVAQMPQKVPLLCRGAGRSRP